MANLLTLLGVKSSLRIKSLRESTTKNNCFIATMPDGNEAFIHNDAVSAEGWTKDADGSISHPELKKFISRREDGSDLWLTFELPERTGRKASTELKRATE